MSFLDGIFNRQPTTPAAPAAATPTQQPTPVNNNGSAGPATKQTAPANPGADPATMFNGQPTAPAGGPENPLDNFVDFFKPKQVDPNAPKAPTLADPFLGPLDPSAFKQQVAQTNFAASIAPETVQKALQGDPQAFMEAINTAAREAFAASAQLTHGLVEHGARSAAERVSGTIDSRVRDFQIRTQNVSNEALAHPAVAPMVTAMKRQIAQSNPQLTPEQVQQQAETYFTQMADVLTAPKQAAAAASAAPQAPNFASYLNP